MGARPLRVPRCGPGLRVATAACLLLVTVAGPLPGQAAPLVDTRVGGLGLVGPATGHPGSMIYNPATLSLGASHSVHLDGVTRFSTTKGDLLAADSATGTPRAGTSTGEVSDLELLPQLFFSAASDLGSESVTLAVALYTPVLRRLDLMREGAIPAAQAAALRPRGSDDRAELVERLFDPAAQGPHRYHVVDMTLYHLYVSAAASYRVIDELILGASVSYVYGNLNLAFVRDEALDGGTALDAGETLAVGDCGAGTPCGYGSDAAAQAIRTAGDSHALGFTLGVLVRPHRTLHIGLAYVSQVLGFGGRDIPAKGGAWVLRSSAALQGAGSGTYADLTGRSTVTYALPDMLHAGVSWRVVEPLTLDVQLRWLNFSAHDAMTMRITGTEVRETPRLPDTINHYRGFQDVFAIQVGAALRPWPELSLEAAVMVETAAVPREAVNMGAVDNLKVDTVLAARWRAWRGLVLGAGYGIAVMPGVTVERSAFSPARMASCVDSRYNVDLEACRAAARGQGLASAAGSYSAMVHRVSLSVGYEWL